MDVDLNKKTVRFYDPLAKDERKIAQINSVLRNANLAESKGEPVDETIEVDDDTLG